jgi:hypothetical protein
VCEVNDHTNISGIAKNLITVGDAVGGWMFVCVMAAVCVRIRNRIKRCSSRNETKRAAEPVPVCARLSIVAFNGAVAAAAAGVDVAIGDNDDDIDAVCDDDDDDDDDNNVALATTLVVIGAID